MNRSRDETSEALLAAAHELLTEAGPDSLTVRRIAKAADMSTMNVYSRFGGKDGVVDELCADGYRRWATAVEALPKTDDIAGDLSRIARAYRDFALENPALYGIMFQSTMHRFHLSTESSALRPGGLTSLVERVQTGLDRGVITSSETETCNDIVGWLWATFHGLVSLELMADPTEQVDWPSMFEAGIQRSINALVRLRLAHSR